MAGPSAIRAWFSQRPVIAIGAFLSGIFLFLGLLVGLMMFPNLVQWHDAANWPTTDAEILERREVYAIRGRTKRPDFTFRYEWKGQIYTATGYDLLKVTTASSFNDETREVLRAHPVGSHVSVLVNPARPAQAVLLRGTPEGLFLYGVPPLFVMMGLIGGFFTVAGGLGWLDDGSTHPVNRVVRRFGRWFLQEKILKIVLFTAFGVVMVGLVVIAMRTGNYLLIGVSAFFGWGLWRASRKPGSQKKSQPRRR